MASYPDAYTEGDTPWRPEGLASPISYHCLKGGTIHMTRHMAAYWSELAPAAPRRAAHEKIKT